MSFGATLHRQVIAALRLGDHEIDNCDLYAEAFNPVMGEQERMQYHSVGRNRAPIAAYADRLLAAEALVLIYPVWNEGFPAILKGFFDRVFIPGVSFTMSRSIRRQMVNQNIFAREERRLAINWIEPGTIRAPDGLN